MTKLAVILPVVLGAGLLHAPCHAQQVRARADSIMVNQKAEQGIPGPALRSGPDPVNSAVGDSMSEIQGKGGVLVGAIKVEGSEQLDQEKLMAALAPYMGQRLEGEQMQDLLSTISAVARAQGFTFAHSRIPEQAVTAGVLSVTFDIGQIDRIVIKGAESDSVRAILAPLTGRPAQQEEVERRLLLADDLPGVVVGNAVYSSEGGEGVLSVEVWREKGEASIGIDNRGVSVVGPVRAYIGYDFSGLIGEDRFALSGALQVTPLDPNELQMGSVKIAYILDDLGTELSLASSYSRTLPDGDFRQFDITGKGVGVTLAVTHPIVRSRNDSLWINGSLDYISIEQRIGSDMVRRDKVLLLGFSLNGYTQFAGGTLRSGLGAFKLLDVAGVTQQGDPLSSRPGASPDAMYFTAWSDWQGPITGQFSARLAFRSQISTAPLFSASQISIGGAAWGRGYDYAERTGDRGVLASMELQHNLLASPKGKIDWAQLYTFADVGYVSNLRNNYGTGDLYSSGFGGRIGLFGKARIQVEAAFPLGEPRFESADQSPRITAGFGATF